MKMVAKERFITDYRRWSEVEKFITEYLRRNHTTDRLDKRFHDEYTNRFGGTQHIQPYGSSPNKDAMKWLVKLYRQGSLNRSIIGIPDHEAGFPNWIYVYTLP